MKPVTLEYLVRVCLRADSGCNSCAVDLLSRVMRETPEWAGEIRALLQNWRNDDEALAWEANSKLVLSRLAEGGSRG